MPILSDDFVDRLRAALRPFGEVKHTVDHRRSHDEDYCGPWGETNGLALDNFDSWLPALGVQAKRERDGSYRGPAVWRGGDNPTSVSYDHRGIRDFKMNEGLTPIEVVRRAGVANTEWDSDNWLREKLGLPVIKRIKLEFGPLFGREFAGVISIPYSEGTWKLRSEAEAPTYPAAPSGAAASKFAMAWLADIALDLDDEWLFKRLIPKVGAVSVFGDSMSFKTFLLIDIAVRASMGRDIAGYKCKNKNPVVYVAAEDAKGVEKYCLAHNIPQSDVPVAIIRVAPNLGTVKGDAIPLGKAIDDQLSAMGYDSPSAIIIDTLNQTLGDADENGPGMQAFMANATLLANGFGCAVLASHHVGHAEKGRERGGSQIKGNSDTRLWVERVNLEPTIVDGVKTYETVIYVVKVKNGVDGFDLKAMLREIVLGRDSDGDDVTTLIVDSVERMDRESKPKKAGRPSPNLEARRDGFVEAYQHMANDVEPVWGLDKRTKVRKVPVRAIHEHMMSAGLLDDDPRNRRFRELKLEMVAPKTGRFIERDGMVWLLYPERPFTFRAKDEN